ncbi:haloacid dehalogenase [Mycolicibacterium wolinskyi]|uniref:Haloacid dehalogenase n=2 Tax=Mycolicibacterium wolinskyi TaxID=59750 RepID=A0A132PSU3_9MYCO|nr:haloacid dehalogenase [Mycolicibacterium wolinskyi]
MHRGMRCVVFDVGETLVDESRMWADLAEQAGVPAAIVSDVLAAVISRGEHHTRVWDVLGADPPERRPVIEPRDLYPDALDCVAAVRSCGLSVGIAGNQPEGVDNLLRAAGLEADFIGSSAAWDVSKPDLAFFRRLVDEAGMPAPDILYVGDRLDNDVLPARAVGMRTAHIRRGPWGFMHAKRPEVALADLRVDSLSELAALLVL